MRRLMPRLLPLAAVLAVAGGAGGCSNNDTIAAGTSVTAPAAATTTEEFSGTLALNGAFSYPFTVVTAGGIVATLTTLTPAGSPIGTAAASPIGMSLGTWNGSACQQVLSNDAAIQGTVVVGQTSSSGTFCVRVYDAVGTVAVPESYVVNVSHP